MTAFIESFASQQLLPPWNAIGAQHWGFLIRLERARVKAYLDTYFNGRYPDRAPYLYVPMDGPQFGLLGIDDYPNVTSENEHAANLSAAKDGASDRLAHRQTYLAFPVLRYALSENNLITEPTIVWVEPIVFSDNDSVVFSSREIWGSDMFLAQMCRPTGGPPYHLHFDMGLIGVKRFNARSLSEMLAVMHVKTGDVTASTVPELVKTIPELLKAKPELASFLQVLAGSASFAGGPDLGLGPAVGSRELNNLKQFRDCYDISAAIYRAIVASKASHTEVANVVLYDASKVEIAFMWSDCMVDLLTNLLNADGPNQSGPPADHAPPVTPPVPLGRRQLLPGQFHYQEVTPHDMDWNMDRLVVPAEFAFSYSSNVRFEVLETLHTYGLNDV
jgi:hypothetical protein